MVAVALGGGDGGGDGVGGFVVSVAPPVLRLCGVGGCVVVGGVVVVG